MEYINILSQQAIDNLLLTINWGDAFIREFYGLSGSYKSVDGSGTINSAALPDIVVLVLTDDRDNPGVEFKFMDVEEINLPFTNDLDMKAMITNEKSGNRRVEFSFGTNCWIKSKEMSYKIRKQAAWGYHTVFGYIFDIEE